VLSVLSVALTAAVQGVEFMQVMNLPIKEIRNLEACRNLRQLHITDCRLERISGLEYNTELREVYLCVAALRPLWRVSALVLCGLTPVPPCAGTATGSPKSKGWTRS